MAQWTWVYLFTGVIGGVFALQQGNALWGTPRILIESRCGKTRGKAASSRSAHQHRRFTTTSIRRCWRSLSTFAATGVYAIAYRIIDTSLTPVRSLVTAAYPKVFRIGAKGIDANYSYAKSLIRKAWSSAYSISRGWC